MNDYIKGIITGGAVMLCAVLLIGAQEASDNEIGRYQVALAHAGQMANAVEIVIDTKNGDVIRRIKTNSAPISKDWTKLKNYLKEQKK
jgi:translation elongation factor EF-Tu-like GTPase